MSTLKQGRTNGRLFCCEASGYPLFNIKIYREGTGWYTETGRNLMLFMTEMFHESPNVKFAKAVIPTQNRVVYFRMIAGSAKPTYEEPLQRDDKPLVERPKRKKQPQTTSYEQPNLGAKQ